MWDPAHAHPALWLVSDHDTKIYLFGTMHMLPPEVVWFDGRVKRAFEASHELVVEIIPPDVAEVRKALAEMGVRKNGPPLRDLLPEDRRARFDAAVARVKLPPAAIDRMQPWVAAISLSASPVQSAGISQGRGVESVLETEARARSMPISALETWQQQIGFFADLPQDDQVAFLAATLNNTTDPQAELARAVRSWATGNVEDTARMVNEVTSTVPALTRVTINERNVRWAQWIRQRLQQPGTVFVAVGAGHFAGPDSVQAILARDGVQARRVQ